LVEVFLQSRQVVKHVSHLFLDGGVWGNILNISKPNQDSELRRD